MNWLIDQLTKPQVLSDGTVREPNNVMRKAADVIKQLSALFEADKAGRIKAEQEYSAAEHLRLKLQDEIAHANSELRALRQALSDKWAAQAEYNKAMNEDNLRNLT